MLPASSIGRAIAVLWFPACFWVLGFGYQQQHIHDMPEAFVWFMIFLAFPCGFAVSAVVGVFSAAITTHFGIAYQPFFDLIPYWVSSVLAGYVQWFILVPKIYKWFRHGRSNT